jgi:hypothetical protein
LAVGFGGTTLLSWNMTTGARLYQPVDGSQSIGFRGDGDSLRVAATSGTEALRVLSPVRATQPVLAAAVSSFDDITFSADARFAALLEQGRLTVRDTATGRTVGKPLALMELPRLLRFVAGDRLVAVQAGEALTWSFRNGLVRRVPLSAGGLPGDVSRDGTKAAFAGDFPEEDGLWQVDLLTGKTLARYPCGDLLQQDAILAFSPDGERLLLSATESTLRLLEARTGKVLATLEHPKVISGAFSSDGRRILTVSSNGVARLWDATAGRLTRTFTNDKGFAGADFAGEDAPGGRSLLTVDGDFRARVLDLGSGKPVGKPIPSSQGNDVRLSPDGRRVLVVNRFIGGATAQLWDSLTGHPLGRPLYMPGNHLQPAFSRDGRRLLLASSKQVQAVDIPFGSAADADLLVRWAEAAGGLTVDPLGDLKPVPDQVARLDALRRETARAPWGRDEAASLIRWFFADPQSRPRSPLSSPAVNPP